MILFVFYSVYSSFPKVMLCANRSGELGFSCKANISIGVFVSALVLHVYVFIWLLGYLPFKVLFLFSAVFYPLFVILLFLGLFVAAETRLFDSVLLCAPDAIYLMVVVEDLSDVNVVTGVSNLNSSVLLLFVLIINNNILLEMSRESDVVADSYYWTFKLFREFAYSLLFGYSIYKW